MWVCCLGVGFLSHPGSSPTVRPASAAVESPFQPLGFTLPPPLPPSDIHSSATGNPGTRDLATNAPRKWRCTTCSGSSPSPHLCNGLRSSHRLRRDTKGRVLLQGGGVQQLAVTHGHRHRLPHNVAQVHHGTGHHLVLAPAAGATHVKGQVATVVNKKRGGERERERQREGEREAEREGERVEGEKERRGGLRTRGSPPTSPPRWTAARLGGSCSSRQHCCRCCLHSTNTLPH